MHEAYLSPSSGASQEADTLIANTGCVSDARYKSHPVGTSISQVWVRACGLSSNRAGNEWPEGRMRRAPPRCSPALLLAAPHRRRLAPSLPLASALRHPAKFQGKAEVPERLWPLAGQVPCHFVHHCFCLCFLLSVPRHRLFIQLSCFLSFGIIELSFSGGVFASSFSPLGSPRSSCRRKTASHAIRPRKPPLRAEWEAEERGQL